MKKMLFLLGLLNLSLNAFGEPIAELQKKAKEGDAVAQYNLGWRYENGKNVDVDDKAAFKWYSKAAEQGFTDSPASLGWMYANGGGVPRNLVNAYAWYDMAASGGQRYVVKHRAALAKKLTTGQIAKAKELSGELLKKIEAHKKAKKRNESP
jgi:TPR repeat protein